MLYIKQKSKFMTRNFITLLLVLTLWHSSAQQNKKGGASISGKLIEQATNQSLPFASIVLKDNNKQLIEGVITDENGSYILRGISVGSYNLTADYNGFKTISLPITIIKNNQKLVLETISLEQDATELNEVVVTGEISEVSLRMDKKIFKVGKDVLSQSTSVSEVLENVPSVAVDPSGAVRLRGNTNVTILINGRRSGLTSAQALEQLPSENVDRIEVITTPSARYDASGSAGIINIILKKNTKGGLTGRVGATIGYPADYRATGSLNYKADRLNLFGTLGIRYTDYEGDYSKEQQTTRANQSVFLNQVQDQHRHDDGKWIYVGADYYFNDKNTITLAFLRNQTEDTDVTDFIYDYSSATKSIDSTLITDGNSNEHRSYNQLELNYTKTFDKEDRKLTFDLQYDFWDSTMKWDVLTNKTFPITESIFNLKTTSTDKNNDIAIQTDYITPLGEKSKLELGVKLESRNVDDSFIAREFVNNAYTIIPGLDNSLSYDEQIIGAYVQYGSKLGKFSYLLGLRVEDTKVDIKNTESNFGTTNTYTDLFPTLNIGYVLSEKTNIGLNYSKRINRPSLWQLNPFSEIEDFNTRYYGNPTLKPAYTNAVEFSTLYKGDVLTLNPSIYYSHTTNTTQWYTIQNDANIFESTLINLDKETRFGVELSVSYAPLKWLSFSGDFNAYNFSQEGMVSNRSLDFNNNTWFSSLSTRIKMGMGLTFQSRFNYQGEERNAQAIDKEVWFINAGLSKKLFKNKANLSFRASNIFNTRKSKSTTTGTNFLVNEIRSRNAARWALSFTYKFDGKTSFKNRNAQRSNRN